MSEQPDEIRATVLGRFSEAALTPEQVKTFPLGYLTPAEFEEQSAVPI